MAEATWNLEDVLMSRRLFLLWLHYFLIVCSGSEGGGDEFVDTCG